MNLRSEVHLSQNELMPEEMLPTKERNRVYLTSLVEALKGKQHHRIPDCDLIVHAIAYNEAMDSPTFACIANKALSTDPLRNFRCVHVLDDGAGCIVERIESIAQACTIKETAP